MQEKDIPNPPAFEIAEKNIEELKKIEKEKTIFPSFEEKGAKEKPKTEELTLKEKISEFNGLLKKASNYISKKDNKNAILAYKEIKEMYEQLIKEEISKTGKEILYNKVTQLYTEILKLQK